MLDLLPANALPRRNSSFGTLFFTGVMAESLHKAIRSMSIEEERHLSRCQTNQDLRWLQRMNSVFWVVCWTQIISLWQELLTTCRLLGEFMTVFVVLPYQETDSSLCSRERKIWWGSSKTDRGRITTGQWRWNVGRRLLRRSSCKLWSSGSGSDTSLWCISQWIQCSL